MTIVCNMRMVTTDFSKAQNNAFQESEQPTCDDLVHLFAFTYRFDASGERGPIWGCPATCLERQVTNVNAAICGECGTAGAVLGAMHKTAVAIACCPLCCLIARGEMKNNAFCVGDNGTSCGAPWSDLTRDWNILQKQEMK